jgi:hydrogenase large subunit
VIVNAVSTGTMWRGLEVILRGRDPRDAWAFVERICGVCTGCHALASCRAVEHALGIEIRVVITDIFYSPVFSI